MRKHTLCAFAACLLAACSTQPDPVDYVNPRMGNISHLLVPTYPTVHLPNGLLRVYPERADHTGDRVRGLPLMVTSHRGKSAFNLSFGQADGTPVKPCYAYRYDREKITPYSYSVCFEEEEVGVRFAPSYRAALYRIDFSRPGIPFLVFNTAAGGLRFADGAVSGWQRVDEWTRVYLHAECSAAPDSVSEVRNGDGAYVVLYFAPRTHEVGVRYGVSFIDEEQAAANLDTEIDGYDVDALARQGRAVWNEKLSKIAVRGCDEDAKHVFYTSLYRTYERMICLTEQGRYWSAFDNRVHTDSIPFYTDDWVWDTYRATHPLRVLIEPRMETDMIRSYLRMASQMERPWMPTFPEVTGDSRRMNSNHGVAVVADAWCKGLRGFDLGEAYACCRAAITEKTLAPWSGVAGGGLTDFYWQHGYIPALGLGEEECYEEVHPFEKRQPVAVTLGTSYDTWCLAQLAAELGHAEDYSRFAAASLNYRNLFNPATRFFHPRDAAGRFIEPFDYARSGGKGARETYGENNGWVYRWDVPHNVADLIRLMGGPGEFVRELDRMFSTPLGGSKYEFYAQLPDHTGNVGQFSMANEPALHIPYLYNYAGAPWKTQKRIRRLLSTWFRNDLMGVPGDEDGGGMSAFVVFSMLGFYPVTPGLPVYAIGSPQFETATVELGSGKSFRVVCRNYAPDHKYIRSARLNGRPLDRCWLTHDELTAGGALELDMGPQPCKTWAADVPPPSFELTQQPTL